MFEKIRVAYDLLSSVELKVCVRIRVKVRVRVIVSVKGC
jgi:hypothetical protein